MLNERIQLALRFITFMHVRKLTILDHWVCISLGKNRTRRDYTSAFGCFSIILKLSFPQDDTAFEKQSALFALAISDIVLINM